jgi:hypothetical protein
VVAVPVFVFAEKYFLFGNEAKKYFLFWQSIGLGFAAGSLFWVLLSLSLSLSLSVSPWVRCAV